MNFELLICDGDISAYYEGADIPCIVFHAVEWSETIELCRMATAQGFRCLLSASEQGENKP